MVLAQRAVEGENSGTYAIHQYWLHIGHLLNFESAQTDFGPVFEA